MTDTRAPGRDELLLLLADGRWPGGGHAHSGGLEAAVQSGAVHDEPSLRSFLLGRVVTNGPTESWFAAQACRDADVALALRALDARYEARTPSRAQRDASLTLGRGLRRVSSALWPEVAGTAARHYVVVLGVVCAAAGLGPHDASRIAVHNLLTGAATAAPKLFAIDMTDALRAAVSITADVDAAVAAGADEEPPVARSALLTEIRAEEHARWDVRLFAS